MRFTETCERAFFTIFWQSQEHILLKCSSITTQNTNSLILEPVSFWSMKVYLQYCLKCRSATHMLQVQYIVQTEPTITPYLQIRLFFCSFNDFCLKKVDFLKAEIIIGLAEIKTMHEIHITLERRFGTSKMHLSTSPTPPPPGGGLGCCPF